MNRLTGTPWPSVSALRAALRTFMGVKAAVVHTLEISDGSRPWRYGELLDLTQRFRDHGLDVSGIEGCVPITDTTRLGREGRDEEIERFKRDLRNLDELDVPVVTYDWMAGKRWARTSTAVPARGGSLTTGYDDGLMRNAPRPRARAGRRRGALGGTGIRPAGGRARRRGGGREARASSGRPADREPPQR